ncbi:Secreted protein [Phytophthora cinnamomi]|uniref:Secreted protein n=1 Tax=Phytophthora cinnamomi TaxID=4785 RepID=UPI00355A7968|nr:Secreted protein [Phytophthora cinnamomi]
MITRASSDQAVPSRSPSPTLNGPPRQGEGIRVEVDVVDVTGGEEPWTTTPARRTSEPGPLRQSKRAGAKPAATAAGEETPKGKKKQGKRPPSSEGVARAKKPASEESESELEDKPPAPPAKKTPRAAALARARAALDSASDSEDKRPAPPAKKARKAPGAAKARVTKVTSTPKRTLVAPRSEEAFNLDAFMASFEPGAQRDEVVGSDALPTNPRTGGDEVNDLEGQVQALKEEVTRLQALVAGQASAPMTAITAFAARAEILPKRCRSCPHPDVTER